jgi:hypothetical protein
LNEERTPEQIATEIRDAVDALNRLLREAAGLGFNVDLEAERVDVIEVNQKAAHVHLHGVYQLVAPTPRPVEAPPRVKRGHNSPNGHEH